MPLPWEFMREVGVVRWVWRTSIRQFCKRVLRRGQTFRLPTGLEIYLPPQSRFGTEVYITGGDVDWGSERLLAAFLATQTDLHCAFDVGANIGYYSLYLSPLVSKVYAFEPDPRVLPDLRHNAAVAGNIEICECALGDARGTAEFVLGSSSEVSHVLHPQEAAGGIRVEIETVDDFVASRDVRVSCIKVDAEGHEIEVFRGAHNTMTAHRPVILAECDANQDLFEWTQPLAYQVFAYVREVGSNHRQFREIVPQAEIRGRTKMLFLVPAENADALASCAET